MDEQRLQETDRRKAGYFNTVIKRDGRVVSFDKTKIADAIFKAAVAVGGEDRLMAEELASAVTLFLRKKFGPKPPTIEQIQDVVEKVLIETGHAKTAKAYILYREKRTQARRNVRVRKRVREGTSSTDLSLLVTPLSKDEILSWDKAKIALALQKEAGLEPELAYEISSAVEEKLFSSEITHISTSLIRELVDNELFVRGLNKKLTTQAIIGMPTYDLETLVFSKSKENANINANNPEAINLAIAEGTLKQYALQRIFSQDIAEAHMKGEIHLHDLGYPSRVYSVVKDEVVYIKQGKEGIPRSVTLGNLFDMTPFGYELEGHEIKPLHDYYIRDRDNNWTKLLRVVRHKAKKKMLFIKTKDGNAIIVTADHPMIDSDMKKIRAEDTIPGETRLITYAPPGSNNCLAKDIDLVKEFTKLGRGDFIYLNKASSLDGKSHASEIKIRHAHNCKYENSYLHLNGKENKIPAKFPLNVDTGWLIGLFASEGNFTTVSRYDKKNRRYRGKDYLGWETTITCGEEEAKRACEILDCLGIRFGLDKKGENGPIAVRIYNMLFAQFLREVLNIQHLSRLKSLPQDYPSYNREFLQGLLAGVIDGDGSVTAKKDKANTRVLIRVSSKTLVTQLKDITSILGFPSLLRNVGGQGSVRVYKGRTIKQNYPLYGISFGVTPEVYELLRPYSIKIANEKFKAAGVSTCPPPGVCNVVNVEEVKTQDEYVYDVTTESGTFVCSGILTHNCSSHSLEYLKKFGLHLGNLDTQSGPAKHARTLTGHLNTFLASMQAYYAGALGVAYINIMYAPYLVGINDDELRQEAQHLIFSASQNAFSRGGQSLFTDHNVHTGVQDYLKKIPAIGPGGKYTGKTYGDYEEVAQRFAKAMLSVWQAGDKDGRPFAFPKCLDKDTKLLLRIGGRLNIYTAEELHNIKAKSTSIEIELPNFNLNTMTQEWIKLRTSAYRGKEIGVAVTLPNRVVLKTTADHPHIILTKDGLEIKEAQQLRIGDILLYRSPGYSMDSEQNVKIDVFDILKKRNIRCQVYKLRNNPTRNNYARSKNWADISEVEKKDLSPYSYIATYKQKVHNLPVSFYLNENWAKLLGYFVAEGSYQQIAPSIAQHKSTKGGFFDEIKSILENLDVSWRFNRSKGKINGLIFGGRLHKELLKCLIPGYVKNSSTKEVPWTIFNSPLSVQRAFLQGLFNGDGTIKGSTISYVTKSKKLAYGIQVLLSRLGIYSTLYQEKVAAYPDNVYHNLSIKGKGNLSEALAFLRNEKFCRWPKEAYFGDTIDISWYSHVPASLVGKGQLRPGEAWKLRRHDYVCRGTLTKLPHPILLEHLVPMPVKKIEETPVDAHAIEVEGQQHTFITADGILTHNCDLHISDDTFKDPKQREILDYACQIASENGAPYFVFDRDAVTLSACFTADTKFLITNSSRYVYEKISDIYDKVEGIEEKEIDQSWKIPTKRYEIINVEGGSASVVPISGALRRRYRGIIYNVKLKDGTSVNVTPDHPFLVLKEGKLIRVRADELRLGDYLPIQKNIKTNLENYITKINLLEYAYKQKNTKIHVSLPRSLHLPAIYLSKKYNLSIRKINTWNLSYKSKYRYPAWILYAERIDAADGKIVYKAGIQESMPTEIELSQELARLLGLYLAEGSINGSSISFAVSQKEPAITEFIVKAIGKIFGTHIWVSDDKNWKSRKIETSSKAVAWFISLFIKGNSARHKQITSLVFNATDEFKKAFMRGFLDGDGYTRKTSTSIEVGFHIASKTLAKDIRALLRCLGINSTIRRTVVKNPRRKDQKLDSYHVRLANYDLYKLDWGKKHKGEIVKNSHSLWRLLPAKEMGIDWARVKDSRKRADLRRRRRSHITNFTDFYNDSQIVKYVTNGMHFLPVTGITTSDYEGFVYDFEVNDAKHAFLLPEGLYSSNCCRLRTQIRDNYMIEHPESLRFCGFQNVTINLPQAAYRAGRGSINGLYKEIDRCMGLAIKAHLQKKEFIWRLMSEPGLPMWEVGKLALDGRPYIDLDKVTYIIGIIGLNECVQYLTGKQLHHGEDIFRLGLKIISFMYLKAKEAEKRLGLKFSLEESPAESATRRLAKVDLRQFPEEAYTVIKGDIENDMYYYTNSIHFAADAPIDLVTRIQKQSKFHTMIESGAIIHAFVGEKLPSKESIMNLVEKTYYNTQAAQITISPEFTVCNSCHRIDNGLHELCRACGSDDVYGMTRIVGYYSHVNNWNKSKLGELADRRRSPEHYAVW